MENVCYLGFSEGADHAQMFHDRSFVSLLVYEIFCKCVNNKFYFFILFHFESRHKFESQE